MAFITNYSEERVNEVKKLIEHARKTKLYPDNIYDKIIINIDFYESYPNIQSISIEFYNASEYCDIYVDTGDDKCLLCSCELVKLEELDKVIDGTLEVKPSKYDEMAKFIYDIFFTKSNYYDGHYEDNYCKKSVDTSIELSKILELYSMVLSNFDTYESFMALLDDCENIICSMSLKDTLFGLDLKCKNIHDSLCERYDSIHEYYNKLPESYKPIRCNNRDLLDKIIVKFSKVVREIHVNTIKSYINKLENIDDYMATKVGILYGASERVFN